MTGQRKRYSAELKTRVALEAIKGHKTANEIAAEYGVHQTQIAQWSTWRRRLPLSRSSS